MKTILIILSLTLLISSCNKPVKGPPNIIAKDTAKEIVAQTVDKPYIPVSKRPTGEVLKGFKICNCYHFPFYQGKFFIDYRDMFTSSKFNEAGLVIEEYTYGDSDSIITSRTVKKYDDKCRLIDTETFGESGKKEYHALYKYDEKGNIIQWKFQNNETASWSTIKYKYVYKDTSLIEEWINEKGSFKLLVSYFYDNNCRLIREISWTFYNYAEYDKRYIYVPNGQLKEVHSYFSSGKLADKTYKNYDSKGKLFEEITYVPVKNSFAISRKVLYDDFGNTIDNIEYRQDGREYNRYTSKFNSVGKEIESIEYKDGIPVSKYVSLYF